MYIFIYICAYTPVSLNALRYYRTVSKATDKQEANILSHVSWKKRDRQIVCIFLTSCVHRIISGLFVET